MCPFLKLSLASRRARIGGPDAKHALSAPCATKYYVPGSPVAAVRGPQRGRQAGGLAACKTLASTGTTQKRCTLLGGGLPRRFCSEGGKLL